MFPLRSKASADSSAAASQDRVDRLASRAAHQARAGKALEPASPSSSVANSELAISESDEAGRHAPCTPFLKSAAEDAASDSEVESGASAGQVDRGQEALPRTVGGVADGSRALSRDATGNITKVPVDSVAGGSQLLSKQAKNTAARGKGGRASSAVIEIKDAVQAALMGRIEPERALLLSRSELGEQISEIVADIVAELGVILNGVEHKQLIALLVDEMIGLGPLEPLIADDTVTDIMVNGPYRCYVERGGKLELTDVKFRDDAQVLQLATRIAHAVGRRVDRSQPLVDARLADGSRVNIIIAPLAVDGPTISIRKFARQCITLDRMVETGNLSADMAMVLKVATRARLNILISGGTGSGKTTLLNAMSQLIDHTERVVTIEDAAELQLQQDHVVRLETRPASLEGTGEISMQDLLKNALRMRPDRIILGEIRGAEAIDMLQAMNTGHDGSISTIHANQPREAMTRLENMVGMSGLKLSQHAVRTQISQAVHLIVQIKRMRDGKRRITSITEIVGMEGEVITAQELFAFKFDGEDQDGNLLGRFLPTGTQPGFTEKARYFGLESALLKAVSGS